jgi:NAD(P)-dependent dehydrogenase (short-subunit alcohol dehydrogenase family)
VTGAAGGIGFGIGAAFHAAGARVALGDVKKDKLDRAAQRFGAPDRVFTHAVDVSDAASVEQFVAASESALGLVTIAVANAGIFPNCPVLDMTPDEWDRVIEINLRGVFLTCQATARRLVAAKSPGKIITIASGAHNSGRRGAAHYCASKAGVVMFTKVFAMEMGAHHINVNCIAPGIIAVDDRDGSPGVSEEVRAALVRNIPWGRAGTTADVANAALFLATPEADFITGEVLSVDGGSATGRTYLPYGRAT